jgi:pyrroline-5-carboxylate reductase
MNDDRATTLGFLGTGAIAEAIIEGLLNVGGFDGQIVVSSRSADRSLELSQRHGAVTVAPTNQAIVDAADIVFLSVLPDQVFDVLTKLDWRRASTIVSVVAGLEVDRVRTLIGRADADVARIIPMPPNRNGLGPIPLHPPHPQIAELLKDVGTVIEIADEATFGTFIGSSALMGFFFELVATNAAWMADNGVAANHAAAYSTSLLHSLAAETLGATAGELAAMPDDCLTPGGLNEQVLFSARKQGLFDSVRDELDAIVDRVRAA